MIMSKQPPKERFRTMWKEMKCNTLTTFNTLKYQADSPNKSSDTGA